MTEELITRILSIIVKTGLADVAIIAVCGFIAARFLKPMRDNAIVVALAQLADEVTDELIAAYPGQWALIADQAVDAMIKRAKIATGKTVKAETAQRIVKAKIAGKRASHK